MVLCLLPRLLCDFLFIYFLTDFLKPQLEIPHLRACFICKTKTIPVGSKTQYFLGQICVFRWCCHPGVVQALQRGRVTVTFPRESNKLINLPEDYSVLINQASSFTSVQPPTLTLHTHTHTHTSKKGRKRAVCYLCRCPRSGADKSRAPTLCLVCGSMLCSQSYCCQTEVDGEDVGACTAHTFNCGAGVGLFLR